MCGLLIYCRCHRSETQSLKCGFDQLCFPLHLADTSGWPDPICAFVPVGV